MPGVTTTLSPSREVVIFPGNQPLHNWDVNLNGSRCLLEAMQCHGCHTIVFSSSATLYGYPEGVPIPETAPIAPINPYGHTKAAVERMLGDLHASAPDAWRIACLRYFNPVGTQPSGRIGENHLVILSNLSPLRETGGCWSQSTAPSV